MGVMGVIKNHTFIQKIPEPSFSESIIVTCRQIPSKLVNRYLQNQFRLVACDRRRQGKD
jgi:hypothetical protein